MSTRLRGALREALRDTKARRTESRAYVKWLEDSERWARDIKAGLKKQWRYKAPDRPALALRTGFGDAVLQAIFTKPGAEDFWDDLNAYRKAKAYYLKWRGEPSQKLFADSAKGLLD